jgi:shikimate kinase
MSTSHKSIALIGMPGSGKSTIGVLLAKELAFHFIDTDLLIQERAGDTLQHIIDTQGADILRRFEEDALLSTSAHRHVISTGGSAVYSAAGMAHLDNVATLVYLQTSVPELLQRVRNFEQRGIIRRPGQTMDELLAERERLYQTHARITICTDGLRPDDVVTRVIAARIDT